MQTDAICKNDRNSIQASLRRFPPVIASPPNFLHASTKGSKKFLEYSSKALMPRGISEASLFGGGGEFEVRPIPDSMLDSRSCISLRMVKISALISSSSSSSGLLVVGTWTLTALGTIAGLVEEVLLIAGGDLLTLTDGTTKVATDDGATKTVLLIFAGGTVEVTTDDRATGTGLLVVSGVAIEVAEDDEDFVFDDTTGTGKTVELIIGGERFDGLTYEGFVPDAAFVVFGSTFCCSTTVDFGSAPQQRNIPASN